MTDCHAQLKPIHFREPSVNLGVGAMQGRLPHLVGEHLLKATGIVPGSAMAHACTFLDFERAARRYGKVGGFAHLATLVKRLKAERPGALLLDGGDTWQGSATALWTNAQDMVDAAQAARRRRDDRPLGVHLRHAAREGDRRQGLQGPGSSSSPRTSRPPTSATRSSRPTCCARSTACRWRSSARRSPTRRSPTRATSSPTGSSASRTRSMQKIVDEARAKGAQLVVLLSHNGMDVDLKLAGRVRGIDAIFGGHTHDGVPVAVPVANAGRHDAGHQRRQQRQVPRRDGLRGQGRQAGEPPLPPAADLLERARGRPGDGRADRQGARAATRPSSPRSWPSPTACCTGAATSTAAGTSCVCDALMDVQGAQIAFSPGFRWGTSLLPGDAITRELMMDQLAITYPYATVTEMSGDADQDRARRRGRQPVQPRSVLPAGRRHGAHRRPRVHASRRPRRWARASATCASPASRSMPTRPTRSPAGRRCRRRRATAGGKPVWELSSRPGSRRDRAAAWRRARINTPRIVGMQGNPGLA